METKTKQVKLFEAKSMKEIEQQLNDFYCLADVEGFDIISTKFIESVPLILQVVYLKQNGK